MKNILIFIITSCISISCQTQVIYGLGTPPEKRNNSNYYIKDLNNNYEAIVGTWKWEDSGELFEITLQKFEMNNYPSTSKQYFDSIFGKYKYIVGGNIIAEISTIEAMPNTKLSLGYETQTKYWIIIKDVVSTRTYSGTFILTSSTTAEMKLEPTKGLKIVDGTLPPFSLPTIIVLTKQ